MKFIVFVCSGNTCRSPLALAAWRVLQQRGVAPQEIAAHSAGLSALGGASAAKYSVEMAREWDADLRTHAAQPLSGELLEADLFFVMSHDQAFALREYFRVAPEKIYLLGSFVGDGEDEILDPFGGSREAYETCAAKIFRSAEGVARALERGEIGGQ